MEFIAHRINTAAGLAALPEGVGAECDLRDFGGRLVLGHEPFEGGEEFEEFLGAYRGGMLIVNVKTERIEHAAAELLNRHNIKDYFFLDSSFPMIISLARSGERNVAVRFSEYECICTALAVGGLASWVWADCFTRMPLDAANVAMLHGAGYRICLVSPELQSHGEDIEEYARMISREQLAVDAICTKVENIARWKEALAAEGQ